jgi:hypothetical protein
LSHLKKCKIEKPEWLLFVDYLPMIKTDTRSWKLRLAYQYVANQQIDESLLHDALIDAKLLLMLVRLSYKGKKFAVFKNQNE